LVSINNLASLLKNQGKLGEAEPLYRTALTARRRTLGYEHPDTLDTLFNFANLLWAQGNTSEALDLFRQELDAVRRVLGEAHPRTQASLRNYTAKLATLKK
jgi:tetratricopeptide (TPR) repeat protein